jgi:L-lactate utilization protein LutC
MTAERDAFLQRVREAVAAGNRPGVGTVPERGDTGYQGAGTDPVKRFCDELTAAGGFPHLVPNQNAALEETLGLLRSKASRRVLLTYPPFADELRGAGFEITTPANSSSAEWRDPFFAADAGISGVGALIAETGTVVMLSAPDNPRSGSLLPPIHIAIAERSQLLPDLFDLFDPAFWEPRGGLPACVSLITGPSKTGDIELRLVTGVHGPGELHVILIAS